MFIPYYDKIEVIPLKKDAMLLTPDQNKEERGEVVSIGRDVKFVKVGDILYFSSWGCTETQEVDGVKRYIIPEASEFILGKEEHVAKE